MAARFVEHPYARLARAVFFFAIHSGDLIYADSGLAGGTRPGRSTACACGLISFKLLRDVRVAVRAVFLLAVKSFRHLQRVRNVADDAPQVYALICNPLAAATNVH